MTQDINKLKYLLSGFRNQNDAIAFYQKITDQTIKKIFYSMLMGKYYDGGIMSYTDVNENINIIDFIQYKEIAIDNVKKLCNVVSDHIQIATFLRMAGSKNNQNDSFDTKGKDEK